MSADALRSLIARVEAATGPDRELDADITIALNVGGLANPAWERLPRGCFIDRGCPTNTMRADRYTASLDAAASLVPEGLSWQSGRRCHSDDGWFGHSIVWEPSDPRDDEAMRFMASAATPALALCAAALRARAANAG